MKVGRCQGCSLSFPAKQEGEQWCQSCINMGMPALSGKRIPATGARPGWARCETCGRLLPVSALKKQVCQTCAHMMAASRGIVRRRKAPTLTRMCVQCGEKFQTKGTKTTACPDCKARIEKSKYPMARLRCEMCGSKFWQEESGARICAACMRTAEQQEGSDGQADEKGR